MKKEYLWMGLAVTLIFLFYMEGPGCPQQAFLGISCMGCGMTRAYLQLLHGNVRGAFLYHPAFWSVPIAAGLLLFQRKIPRKVFYIGMICIFLIFFCIYIYRILHHDPILIFDIRRGYVYKIWKKFPAFM